MNYKEAIEYLTEENNRCNIHGGKGSGKPGCVSWHRRWNGISYEIVEFAWQTDARYWRFNMMYNGIPLEISAGDLSFMQPEKVKNGILMFYIKSPNSEYKEYMQFCTPGSIDVCRVAASGDVDFVYGKNKFTDSVICNIKYEDMIKTGTMKRPFTKNSTPHIIIKSFILFSALNGKNIFLKQDLLNAVCYSQNLDVAKKNAFTNTLVSNDVNDAIAKLLECGELIKQAEDSEKYNITYSREDALEQLKILNKYPKQAGKNIYNSYVQLLNNELKKEEKNSRFIR